VFVQNVAKHAPKMVIEFAVRGGVPIDALQSGVADLVLQLSSELPAWVDSRSLYTDRLVCLVRKDHPTVGRSLTLAAYQRMPHIRISPEGYGASAVDNFLDSAAVRRQIEFYVYSFGMAYEFVARTDAILTAPWQMAKVAAKRLGLRVLEPPIELPQFSIDVVWHRGRDDDALAWLRDRLCAAAASAEDGAGDRTVAAGTGASAARPRRRRSTRRSG
jgi:DNA-binding transcriptional LysR family regulator